MDDLITPHNFVDDCDCHQCSLRARDQLRTEVDRLRNIEAAAVAAVDFDQWQGDEWYESMIALQKALHDSHEDACQNCDGTGDVTNQVGEYLGQCNCGAPSQFLAEMTQIDAELKVGAGETAVQGDMLLPANDPNSGAARGPIAGGPLE